MHDPLSRAPSDELPSLMIGIGTLLNQHIPSGVPKAIMGTGTGYGNKPERDDSWHVYFTRGPLTAKRLGLDTSMAITDGAILCAKYLPIQRAENHTSNIGFMPHCSTAKGKYWQTICEGLNMKYIDPRNSVEQVFSELACIDRLYTEAMHGAILADSFRIPWVAVKTHEHILDFKWQDWCQSLDLEFAPIILPSLWEFPIAAGPIKRSKQLAKCYMAKSSLKKAIKKTKFTLSTDKRHNTSIEQIEEKLMLFENDHKKGLFNS